MLVKDLLPKNILDRAISIYDIGIIKIFEKNKYTQIDFYNKTHREDLYNEVINTYKDYHVVSVKPITTYIIGKQYGKISITESYIEITISKE